MTPMSQSRPANPLPVEEPVRRTEVGPWTIELLPACGYEARYTATESSIGFAFDSQCGTHAIGTDRIRPFDALPNSLAFVPAGCDVFSRSAKGGEYLLLRRNDGMLDAGEQPLNNVIDSKAIAMAQQMRQTLLSPTAQSASVDWESWSHALAERLLVGEKTPALNKSSLTGKRLRLLDEFIDAQLDGPLSVQAMAQLLALSEGYFMRAFAQATGKTPHSYLIDRRLARARHLLRTTGATLAAIAQACGFASQAHMATTFKQRLGVSPVQLRR